MYRTGPMLFISLNPDNHPQKQAFFSFPSPGPSDAPICQPKGNIKAVFPPHKIGDF